MKTFNRGTLKRLAKAGKLSMVGSYHFDDMMGEDRRQSCEIPVKFGGDHVEGVVTLKEWDFDSSCGRAWLNENGTVHLKVHSNCSYTFRIKN